MPLICSACLHDFPSVRISPVSGARYCDNCWRKLDLAEHINRPVETQTSETPIINGIVVQQHPCGFCGFQYRPGREIPEVGWVCEVCERALETDSGDTMSGIQMAGMAATVHVCLKFKGSARAEQFFNYVMDKLDRDWPLKPGGQKTAICAHCGGYEYPRAMMDAGEVKKVANVCGLRKLKIRYWGEAAKCKKPLMLVAAQVN